MEKVDVVIAVVGAVAILATVLGVVFYEEVQGNVDIHFPESATEISDSRTGVSQGNHDFPVMLTENATALQGLEVTIAFTGQQGAIPSSGGSYKVEVSGPNGTFCEKTAAWSTGSTTIAVDECRWADAPAPTAAPDTASAGMNMTWDEDVRIRVIIQNPADPLVGQPTISYTYDVSYTADLMAFRAAVQPADASGNI